MARLPSRFDQGHPVVTFAAVLVGLWIVISVLGFVVRALFFLTFVGIIALIITAVWFGYRMGRRP